MQGKILHGVFSTKRLRPGFVRIAHDKAASTIEEVRNEMSKAELDKTKLSTKTEIEELEKSASSVNIVFSLLCEGDQHQNLTKEKALFYEYTDVPKHLTERDQVKKIARRNLDRGTPQFLSDRQINRMNKNAVKLPSTDSELRITKAKFKAGHLHVLMSSTENTNYNF